MKSSSKKNASSAPEASDGADNSIGDIKVHENVIYSIVKKTASTVQGVSGLAPKGIIDTIAGMVGAKSSMDSAVGVTMDKDCVEVDVRILVAMGCHVPTVAANLQAAIGREVKNISGMEVSCVNVHVVGFAQAAEEEERKQTAMKAKK